MFHALFEVTLGQLTNKQQSITRLFPDFFSNPEKVPGVISKGGVRLSGITEDRWNFKVHSGTEEGLWYDVVIRWKDLKKDVEKLVSDRRNWTKDKKRADLRKIAAKLFKDGNVELSCTCPAQQYWGPAYQLTQKHAKYGDQEDRSPDIRNPKKYGQYCKHVQVLMRTLPFYKSTIANWLGKEYKDLIQKAEGAATKTATQYRAAGQALAKRLARESLQESRHGQDRCMKCSAPPEVELLWAEGMGHAWFCMKCFKHWATKGDGKGEVCAVKKVKDGKASNWKDNTSPNIIDQFDFLKGGIKEGAVLPPIQQRARDRQGVGDPRYYDLYGYGDWRRCWVLNDGSVIDTKGGEHYGVIGGSDEMRGFLNSGAIRLGQKKNSAVYIEIHTDPSEQQIEKVHKLFIDGNSTAADIDDYRSGGIESTRVNSWERLEAVLQYGVEFAKVSEGVIVEGTLPDLQQKILKANKLSKLTRVSDESEPWIKFWILNDGTVVPVADSHPESCTAIGCEDDELMMTGALRGHIDDHDEDSGLLSIQVRTDPTKEQIRSMEKLAIRYHVDRFTYDDWRNTEEGYDFFGLIKNAKEIGHIVEFGPEGLDESVQESASLLPDIQAGLCAIREQNRQTFRNVLSRIVQEYKIGTKDLSRDLYWLLPDGNTVSVMNFEDSARVGNTSVQMMEKLGCFQIQVDRPLGRVILQGANSLNERQKSWLQKLLVSNQIEILEVTNNRTDEWDELGPDQPTALIEGLITFFKVGEGQDE